MIAVTQPAPVPTPHKGIVAYVIIVTLDRQRYLSLELRQDLFHSVGIKLMEQITTSYGTVQHQEPISMEQKLEILKATLCKGLEQGPITL